MELPFINVQVGGDSSEFLLLKPAHRHALSVIQFMLMSVSLISNTDGDSFEALFTPNP